MHTFLAHLLQKRSHISTKGYDLPKKANSELTQQTRNTEFKSSGVGSCLDSVTSGPSPSGRRRRRELGDHRDLTGLLLRKRRQVPWCTATGAETSESGRRGSLFSYLPPGFSGSIRITWTVLKHGFLSLTHQRLNFCTSGVRRAQGCACLSQVPRCC